MNLFDHLVDTALRNQSALAPLRPVVEKELLHHDILREMNRAGLLQQLTFMGGTCLRLCYGATRLSEDLDFTGGVDFQRNDLKQLADTLESGLEEKYGLSTTVSKPTRDQGNVDTWRVRVQTRPERKDLPLQRINIDICAIPSHDPLPMMLLNPYGVDMGTGGLILKAQSREEILADKLVALALRPNRIKNRDLWDIVWLHQQGVQLPTRLIPLKLHDHHCSESRFADTLRQRMDTVRTAPDVHEAFRQEMRRFLPPDLVQSTVATEPFWHYLCNQVQMDVERVLYSEN